MPQIMEKSLYKPSFVKLSDLQHVKAAKRTELVAITPLSGWHWETIVPTLFPV